MSGWWTSIVWFECYLTLLMSNQCLCFKKKNCNTSDPNHIYAHCDIHTEPDNTNTQVPNYQTANHVLEPQTDGSTTPPQSNCWWWCSPTIHKPTNYLLQTKNLINDEIKSWLNRLLFSLLLPMWRKFWTKINQKEGRNSKVHLMAKIPQSVRENYN